MFLWLVAPDDWRKISVEGAPHRLDELLPVANPLFEDARGDWQVKGAAFDLVGQWPFALILGDSFQQALPVWKTGGTGNPGSEHEHKTRFFVRFLQPVPDAWRHIPMILGTPTSFN
jgi:hypothetical protein